MKSVTFHTCSSVRKSANAGIAESHGVAPAGRPFHPVAIRQKTYDSGNWAIVSVPVAALLLGAALYFDLVDLPALASGAIVRDQRVDDIMHRPTDRVAAMLAAETDEARCYEILATEIRKALSQRGAKRVV